MNFIKSVLKKIRAFAMRYSNKGTAVALGVLVIFALIALTASFFGKGSAPEETKNERQVRLSTAGGIGGSTALLEVTGEVKSRTQGDLRTQSAGVVTQVNARVGQQVGAGAIIVSIENASQIASVAQAQASVAQAQASLSKTTGGTREQQLAVLASNTANARQAVEEAQISAKNTLRSAYAVTDSTFTGGIDVMFDDADSANPRLLFVTTNSSSATSAEHARFLLQATIDRHSKQASSALALSGDALRAELTTIEGELVTIKNALDSLNKALDGAVSDARISDSTIATYKATASSARSSVLSTLSTLSTARSALNNTQSALTVAIQNEEQGVVGAQQEDIALAQAQVDAAKAGLSSAYAALEKTRVRAPVSGTVQLLTVEKGDFVSSFEDVGLVANEGALEVQTFVSEAVVKRLSIGTPAVIGDVYRGVVTSIAPGIDPTRRQIEVRVAISDTTSNLTNGARTKVVFQEKNEDVSSEAQVIRIPISALKLIGSEAFVFSVSSDFKLIPHPVVLGEVVQSTVVITEGITADQLIVVDARGLNKGDTVTVLTE